MKSGTKIQGYIRIGRICAASGILISILLSWFLSDARDGIKVLCNRLFSASEAVNRYLYHYFPVKEGQDFGLAVILVCLLLTGAAILIFTARSKIPALCTAIAAAGVQIYFGLPFPAWIQVPLYAGIGLKLFSARFTRNRILYYAGGVLIISLLAFLIRPGTDPLIETASETVRDYFSVGVIQDPAASQPEGEPLMSAVHLNLKTLSAGDQIARSAKEYELIIQSQEQISRPEWVSYLRTAFLFLLIAALLIFPFAPFLLFRKQRMYLQQRREQFQSEDLREAVRAIFCCITVYLEVSGYGNGNVPFCRWPESWQEDLPQSYTDQFLQGVQLFEEAVYSSHPMEEECRNQLLNLLQQTRERMTERIGWKQKLKLQYILCINE